jgi:hypothetical protein
MIVLFLCVLLAANPDPLPPQHACAEACCCPCLDDEPCDCDGRTCLLTILDYRRGTRKLRVENAVLPKHADGCFDRPLAAGRTLRRKAAQEHGTYWICNDPRCWMCCRDNAEFAGTTDEP